MTVNLWNLGWFLGVSGGIALVVAVLAVAQNRTRMGRNLYLWLYAIGMAALLIAGILWLVAIPLRQWPPIPGLK